jgi:HEAT repeat protein/CRP-like cAMP-binding protein
MMVVWGAFALNARREYMRAFRRSIEQQDVQPAELRLDSADLSSIETLLGELAHADARRVIYAIDMLEALDKRQLVTPLLLRHDSAEVRARALRLARYTNPAHAERWLPGVERALADEDGEVRLAAARALATLRGEAAVDVMRPYLDHHDPNLVITAAAALASSDIPSDVERAEQTLQRIASDTRESNAELRRQVARALGLVTNPRFRPLLVPLLYDDNYLVARAAVNSAGTIGGDDFLFVPTLVGLMRNRRLKEPARKVLVGYGEAVVPTLSYFLRDEDEDIWVRRHVPSTLARIPGEASLTTLLATLDASDGFLRYKAVTALEHLHRENPEMTIDREVIEKHVFAEVGRAFGALTLYTNMFVTGSVDPSCLLARVLMERRQRAMNRMFRLLGLVYPSSDIAAVVAALRSSEARQRSGAVELLDNMLAGELRRRVMLLVDDMPEDERVRRGNVIYRTRARDIEDTLAQLIHDENQVVAASAILLVEERGMTSLSGDLEHVVAQRDPRDWYVFEAASWALAASRMPAERRRQLWQEPLPAVVLVDTLRRLPLFDFSSIDELFRIAGLGTQVRHEAGRTLYARGASPTTLQFVLDGRVEVTSQSGVRDQKSAPAPLAFEEILEGHPMRVTVRALEPTICLSIGAEDFLSLLAENVELAEGMMRWLIESHPSLSTPVLLPGDLAPDVRRKVGSRLQTVDRVLLLQSSRLFKAATGAQLLRLAASARPVDFKAGSDPLAHTTEPSTLVVLTGTLDVTTPDGNVQAADAGDIIGMFQALAGKPVGATLAGRTDGTALRFPRSDLFDVLADDSALLQSVFAALLRAAAQREPEPQPV